MEAAHRGKVLTLVGPKYVGICSCGFVGDDKNEKNGAQVEINTHIVTAARAAQEKKATPLLDKKAR